MYVYVYMKVDVYMYVYVYHRFLNRCRESGKSQRTDLTSSIPHLSLTYPSPIPHLSLTYPSPIPSLLLSHAPTGQSETVPIFFFFVVLICAK